MNSLKKLKQEVKANQGKFKELTAEQLEILNAKMDLLLSIGEGHLNDSSKIDKYLDVIETFFKLKKQVENEDYYFIFYDDKFKIVGHSFNQFETIHIIKFTEDGYAMQGKAEHAKDYEQLAYRIDVEFGEKKFDTFENLVESIHVDVAQAFDVINQKKRERIERNQRNEIKTMNEPKPTPPPVPSIPTKVDIPDF
ncbi:NADH dehydrogenase subunit 2 [Bacillus cereus 95/8201]|uniref:hypothetical protein n=1 Tax=Bacillus cereus group TaxID=86661 RepID=UPI0001A0885D|nr:hypothetical protein [Bacillus cereus]AJH62313.1 putative nADH dehydrogenase subunit 2 [Bacillus cereus]AJK37097.1 putative nADH dehydrogenase subunit 2 [Bacillus cereus]EEL18151.1 NADH dehydrogenase subunit 2 [Bacillus cereus 95/8201]KWU54595.1 hypothetical protein AWW71_02915 [Bacillus cereus]KWW52915.1 hypothetical protein AWW69_19950 [Bacillus cereus]